MSTFRWILGLCAMLTGLSACDPGACERGELGCACAAAERCADGLTCSNGTCVAPEEVALTIPAEARACEVVLRDVAGQVAGARFAEGVTGALVREAPRTALSFAAPRGGSLGVVRVQVLGAGEAFSVERSRCFDASGSALADGVRVGG